MRKKSAVAVAVLSAAMLLPSANAFAGTFHTGWSVVLPAFQQEVTAGSQIKSSTTSGGQIRVDATGSDYKVNARMGNGTLTGYGIEAKDIAAGTTAVLGNSYCRARETCFLQVFNSVISPVGSAARIGDSL